MIASTTGRRQAPGGRRQAVAEPRPSGSRLLSIVKKEFPNVTKTPVAHALLRAAFTLV